MARGAGAVLRGRRRVRLRGRRAELAARGGGYTEAIKLLEGAFLAKKARDDKDADANDLRHRDLLRILSDVTTPSDVTTGDVTIDEDEADFFVTAARLLAGRALAYELAGAWSAAVAEYDKAVATAARGGAPADPLILNQRANALAQSGDWAAARLAYLQSAQGFGDAGESRPSRLAPAPENGTRARSSPSFAKFRADGVAFASANAALALAELGDLRGAELELRAVSGRAPGLVDARARSRLCTGPRAGRTTGAGWEFACDSVDVGCAKYRDNRWVAETPAVAAGDGGAAAPVSECLVGMCEECVCDYSSRKSTFPSPRRRAETRSRRAARRPPPPRCSPLPPAPEPVVLAHLAHAPSRGPGTPASASGCRAARAAGKLRARRLHRRPLAGRDGIFGTQDLHGARPARPQASAVDHPGVTVVRGLAGA